MDHLKQYPHRLSDRLVAVMARAGARPVIRAKRVASTCVLTHSERMVYVQSGPAAAVRLIKESRGVSLRLALDLLNQARGHNGLRRRAA